MQKNIKNKKKLIKNLYQFSPGVDISIKFPKISLLGTFNFSIKMRKNWFYRSKLKAIFHQLFLYFNSKKLTFSITQDTLYWKRKLLNHIVNTGLKLIQIFYIRRLKIDTAL